MLFIQNLFHLNKTIYIYQKQIYFCPFQSFSPSHLATDVLVNNTAYTGICLNALRCYQLQ